MLLAIDAGNTHIVLGCLEGDSLRFTARLRTLFPSSRSTFVSSPHRFLERRRSSSACLFRKSRS